MAGSAIAVITPLAIMFEDHLLLGLAAAGADPVLVCAFGDLAAWLYISWAFGPYVALTALFLPLLFPDGQLRSARWRPIAWLAVLASILFTTVLAISSEPIDASARSWR